MKNGRGADYAQLSCARPRAGRDGRVLTPSTACPAEWPIPSPRPADSIPPAGIHDARQRQCDLCHASGSSCATPRHHRGTDSRRPTTAPLPGRPRTRTGAPTCTTPSSLNRVCTEPDWLSPRLNSCFGRPCTPRGRSQYFVLPELLKVRAQIDEPPARHLGVGDLAQRIGPSYLVWGLAGDAGMLTHSSSYSQDRCARSSCRRRTCQKQEHRGER